MKPASFMGAGARPSAAPGGGQPALSPRRLAMGIAVSVVCGAVLAVRLDWAAVGAALAGARWGLVGLAAALTLTHLGLRAVRWRLMLGREAPPLGTLLWAYAVGVATGLTVPASGEFARALLLARRSGLRTSYVLGSVAVEKLLDLTAVGFLVAAGLWSAARHDQAGSTAV